MGQSLNPQPSTLNPNVSPNCHQPPDHSASPADPEAPPSQMLNAPAGKEPSTLNAHVLAASAEPAAPNLNPLLNPTPTATQALVPASQSLNPHLSSAALAQEEPSTVNTLPALVEAEPLPVPSFGHQRQRNGRVARLPRSQRDMVNRMIWNAIPYKNIAAALRDAGFPITERQISSWVTDGGYDEWKADQEFTLNCRLDQDRLLQFLRRDDAPELPEIGMQVAATRLSQSMLQKLARGDDPEANLKNFSQMVELLCRLNRALAANQKSRDDAQLTLGPEHNPAQVKEKEQVDVIENEEFYCDPPADSGFKKPKQTPMLPQVPTGFMLAAEARTEKLAEQLRAARHNRELQKSMMAGVQASAKASQPNSAPSQPS